MLDQLHGTLYQTNSRAAPAFNIFKCRLKTHLLTTDFTENCNVPLSLLFSTRRTINFDKDDDDDDGQTRTVQT